MLEQMIAQAGSGIDLPLAGVFTEIKNYLLVFLGFSVVIFVHELGHFLAAKWCDVRVDRFAIGFGRELFGFTRGETRYSFNFLPLGGYVKMLGQEDFDIDKSGEIKVKDDPRAFTNKPVGQRMIIVSAGVVMNLIFGALLFMLAFMVGIETWAPRVGLVQPGSVAESAGLQVGDRILEIDGEKIREFQDIHPAVMLARPDEPMTIAFERPDPAGGPPERKTVTVTPDWNEEEGRLQIGIAPMMNNVIKYTAPDPHLPEGAEAWQVDDRVIEVNGKETTSLFEIKMAVMQGRGEYVPAIVERPVGEREDGRPPENRTVETMERSLLRLGSTTTEAGNVGHLCGFVPRCEVQEVVEDSPASEAGFKAGDVIVKWGGQLAPRIDEILTHIKDHNGEEIAVTVARPNGKDDFDRVKLTVRPTGPKLFGLGKPRVGLELYGVDEFNLVVADIVPKVTENIETPAAILADRLPRGSRITHVNDEPVGNWHELLGVFLELAGTDIKLTWETPDSKSDSDSIYVPQTIGTAGVFELPPDHVITRIGEHKYVSDGERSLAVSNWRGAMIALKRELESADEQGGPAVVEIEHRDWLSGERFVESVELTPEMVDTWPMRASYGSDTFITDIQRTTLREPNPVGAMMLGVKKTWYFVEQVYRTFRSMLVDRSISMEKMSGPVGIVHIGSIVAGRSLPMLLYFLGMISANLAVLNFLPLPIVDGGVFTFLIIEKIKGSPLSLKFQMITQLVGLALIITVFLIVTFNDISQLL